MTIFDYASIITGFAVLCLSGYAAWVNLIGNRISKYGFDAFILFIGKIFDEKQINYVRNDPKMIRRMGIIMVLFLIGSVWGLVDKIMALM